MLFVDTHCHLDYPSFENDLESVVQHASDAGVYRIVVPGLNISSSYEAVRLAEKYESIYATIGVHPSDVDDYSEKQIPDLYSLAKHPRVVGIGEIGLDYYHRSDNKDLQLFVLNQMLEISRLTNKPVILHSRNALTELMDIITEWHNVNQTSSCRGIFHAFEGTFEEAQALVNLGFLLGAGGPVTYKNAKIKHEVFSKIGLSNIVLETDAPFLPPQEYRGTRNEPQFIPLIAKKIAELQDSSLEKVAIVTTQNALNLFNWED